MIEVKKMQKFIREEIDDLLEIEESLKETLLLIEIFQDVKDKDVQEKIKKLKRISQQNGFIQGYECGIEEASSNLIN